MSETRAPANDLDVIQDMIAISADRLEGLRMRCATSNALTQQEIRTLETKLVRMFSELLLTKERLQERIPASGLPHTTENELKQWLRVVGLSPDSLKACLATLSTLEQLLEQNDEELRHLMLNNPAHREEEMRRLTRAMQNLRKCKEFLSCSSDSSSSDHESKENLMDNLFWDSWDRHHHQHQHRGSVGNIGVMASPRTHRVLMKQARQHQFGNQSPSNDERSCKSSNTQDDCSSLPGSTFTPTLTPSPPSSPFTMPQTFMSHISGGSIGGGGSLNGTPLRVPAGTPPPLKKHQTLLNNCSQPLTPTHGLSSNHHHHHHQTVDKCGMPLSKSKSNELHFHENSSHSLNNSPSIKTAAAAAAAAAAVNSSSTTGLQRSRLHTDPSPDSYSSASSDILIESGGNNNPNNLQVPRSPCTPLVSLGMGHTISHRFTKVFKMMATCDLCQKQMFFGLKCKECKYRCHKDCETNVPPSCGLPREYIDEFKKTLQDQVGGFHPLSGGGGGGGHSSTNQSSVNTSPNLNTMGKNRTAKRLNKPPSTAGGGVTAAASNADSSSPGSSCNSSSPSSPALFIMQHHQQQHQHSSSLASALMSGGSNSIGGNSYIGSAGCGGGNNIMNSSGGGSSSTSSNMLSTPSSFHKNSSQFNFPDVTITSNCNQSIDSSTAATQTLYSSQMSNSNSDVVVEYVMSPQDYLNSSSSTTTTTSGATTTTKSAVTEREPGGGGGNGGGGSSSNILNNSYSNNIIIGSSTNNKMPSFSSHSTGGGGGGSPSMTMSMVSTSTGTFYARKLSSAGVAAVNDFSDTHKSNDSDKTVSLSGSTSASTDSDRTPVRLDSTEDADSGHWPRQNSLSAKEWDIPYGDLCLLEQIGKGRFGTVHRALWHGDVAVKLLKEDYLHDERMLEAFRLEVANFKKTRHENLVLFMGACMNPPYLAIVTSLCKGNTLYTYIHTRRDKFTINKTTLVAQQISQGMGYLHARGILHKDLRTKNIFLENGKVIITDFGLFSSTKLLYCDIGLGVPRGWLCYMSPELMRALLPTKPSEEVLPFSRSSDVYSFGTVWYELLCGEFPFRMQPPESIIWQVGRGMKQTLANLHTSRDVKDILMLCWSFQADDRPDFSKLLTKLEKLPKKRLARSPSHPIQLSRSAESVF